MEKLAYSDKKHSPQQEYQISLFKKIETRLDNRNIIKSKKSQKRDVCLWGNITGYGVGELVEVERSLNSIKYINIYI